jgi:hypothetical protein
MMKAASAAATRTAQAENPEPQGGYPGESGRERGERAH